MGFGEKDNSEDIANNKESYNFYAELPPNSK